MSRRLTLFSVSLFLIAILIVVLLYFQHRLYLSIIFNSDTITYPMFLKTVLLGKLPFSSWYPSTGLYYFPNMTLVLLGLILTNWSYYLSVPVIFGLQLTILYLVLIWFLKIFLEYRKAISLATFVFLFLVSLTLLNIPRALSDFLIFLQYANHFYAFPFVLILLGLFCQELTNNTFSKKKLFLIALISVLCTLSDSLFIAWALFPILLSLICLKIYSYIDNKKFFWWVFLVAISIPVSLKLQKFLSPHAFSFKPYFSFSRIAGNFELLLQAITTAGMKSQIWFALSALSSTALMIVFLLSLLFRNIRYKMVQNKYEFFLLGYNFFLTTFLISSGLMIGPVLFNIRYLMILFVMPSLILLIFIFEKFANIRSNYFQTVFSVLSCFLVLGLGLKVFSPWKKLEFTYMPDHYSCIYHTFKKYNLTQGISGYWEAKPLMVFSPNQKLIVEGFIEPLQPYCWLTSSKWFLDRYDFAIYDKRDVVIYNKHFLFANAGQPRHIVSCGPYKIFIYGKNNLYASAQVKQLYEGKAVTLSMSQFESKKAIRNTESISAIDGVTKSGIFIYGPYILLPEGKYKLSIAYRAKNIEPANHCQFDIVHNNGNVEIYRTPIFGKDNQLKKKTINFYVSQSIRNIPFEFRFFYGGKGKLTVYDMTLQRLVTDIQHT